MSNYTVIHEQGLYKLRRKDGSKLPLAASGCEYCCERADDLEALVEMAKRDGVIA